MKLRAGVATALAGSILASTAAGSGTRTVVPRLEILAPRAGDVVEAPFVVRYRIRGFRVGKAPLGHVHAYVGTVGTGLRIELFPRRLQGSMVVPDHPLLSGRRDLTFVLARADHRILTRPSARFTVQDLIIEGSR